MSRDVDTAAEPVHYKHAFSDVTTLCGERFGVWTQQADAVTCARCVALDELLPVCRPEHFFKSAPPMTAAECLAKFGLWHQDGISRRL